MMTRFSRWLVVGAAALVVAVPWGITAWAQQHNAPRDLDKQIAVAVCSIMEKGHITRHKVDDTISQRTHKAFLRFFDPLKMYFMQPDIDEFAKLANDLDDRTVVGDLSFAFKVYERFLQRLDERAAWAHELSTQNYDFNKEETIVRDPDHAVYAKNEAEARERWRAWIKFDLVSRLIEGDSLDKARERIQKRYKLLAKRWRQLDSEEIVEVYLDALTNAFDPHSTYMSPKTLEDFNIAIQVSLEGIGALLSNEDGSTLVKEIVPGGAAAKDGRLKPGDKIVGVGEGKNGELVDVVEMKLRDVVKLIRGKAGTIVRLEITPTGTEKRVVYELTRQRIELEDKEAKGEILETPKTETGAYYRVGVIKLPSFYADNEARMRGDGAAKTATEDVRRILEDFKTKGVDGVVLDLRRNGGGLLNEAITLTGLFIDEGPVVEVRDFDGRVTVYKDEFPGVVYGGPLIVLVSKFSASASEIFAGAIQDYGRGIVVGDSSTHGKGTVQKVFDLGRQFQRLFGNDNMGAVKLTMQKFYRVNGQSTQNRGVLSDIVLPSDTDHPDFGESKLDYALEFDRIHAADYVPMNTVSPELIKHLRHLAAERQEKLDELKKLAEQKKRKDAIRARKAFTFTEASLRKERAELGDVDKEENEDEAASKKKEEKFGADPYTREVLRIMADFIRLKDSALTAR